MVRRLLASILVASVVLTGAAAPARAERGAIVRGIELVDGAGRVSVNLRGAILGWVEAGRLTITDLPAGAETEILVLGAEWQRRVSEQTTVYGGAGLRFRLFQGAWLLRIQGGGINASAVGRGTVKFRGAGRYSLGGAAYQSWQLEWTTIRLGG